MAVFKDLTGQKFGRLTVVNRAENTAQGKIRWLCTCDCGATTRVSRSDLLQGRVKSCGCLRRETTAKMGKANATHSEYGTRLYHVWQGMKQRCSYAKGFAYTDYGGRGIYVCDEWRNSFEEFRDWAMANGYRDDLSIDRIDVNGNYEPSNCRWATMKIQQNNRRNNRLLTINGVTMTLAGWADKTGISSACIANRLSYGWPEQDLLIEPNLANSKIRREKNSYA